MHSVGKYTRDLDLKHLDEALTVKLLNFNNYYKYQKQ